MAAKFDGGERFAVPGNLEADSDPEPTSVGSDDHATTNPLADGTWPVASTVPPENSSRNEFSVDGNLPEGSEPVPSGADRNSPGGFTGWPEGEDRFMVDGNPKPNSDPQPDGPDSASY